MSGDDVTLNEVWRAVQRVQELARETSDKVDSLAAKVAEHDVKVGIVWAAMTAAATSAVGSVAAIAAALL